MVSIPVNYTLIMCANFLVHYDHWYYYYNIILVSLSVSDIIHSYHFSPHASFFNTCRTLFHSHRYLHAICSVAVKLATLPAVLAATQWYWPASEFCRLVILRDPLPSCCLRESRVSSSPFLYQVMFGVEIPDALQGRVVVVEGADVVLLGCDTNCGDVGAVCVCVCMQWNKHPCRQNTVQK